MRYHPPIYVLCVSSHFWPFTKVNFVLTNLQKSWDSVRPPPPGWDKIPSLSKELFVRLPLEPLWDHTFGAGLNLTCPSFWGLNSDDFPFFTSSLSPLESELAPFEKLQEIGNIWEIALKVALAPNDFSLIFHWFPSDFSNVANFLWFFKRG